ncbi:hypothetical protein [Legionella cardiaca]|uniref:Dot/Icm T4SS effector n=1 Tax=Legionella cardiaca TaxID=1071983 RepID=A0ABY8AZ91_9GAMM|nr:hypothetical protein [Legionella cardiaca]WED44422.1 hypothetical protein PXX05_06465 [Legionella cardiaca]
MLSVDNSGRGNCMYYAYSISLMYFLRAQKSKEIVEDILTKLKLNESQKAELNKLLSKDPRQQFTKTEIETIIEPILGRATRDLAAEHTKVEFKADPPATSLFTATKYGLEYYIKQSLKAIKSDFSDLITHEFNNRNFTEAEIYRVPDMKVALEKFAATIMPDVVKKLEQQWGLKEEELKEQTKPPAKLTESDIKFHQAHILDNILREKTIAFFLEDDDRYLNKYKEHLKEEFVWGTEETLMVLHRAIQGECMERNKGGSIDTFYDTIIVLHLHRNNASPFFQEGEPEIIINHYGNHWTSKIPETIFQPETKAKKSNQVQQECMINLIIHNDALVPAFSADSKIQDYFRLKGIPFSTKDKQTIVSRYDLVSFFNFIKIQANDSPFCFKLSSETKAQLPFLRSFLHWEEQFALEQAFSLDLTSLQEADKMQSDLGTEATDKKASDVGAETTATKQSDVGVETTTTKQSKVEAETTTTKQSKVEAETTTTKQSKVEAETTTTKQSKVEAETTTTKQSKVEAETTTTKQSKVEAETTTAKESGLGRKTADKKPSDFSDKVAHIAKHDLEDYTAHRQQSDFSESKFETASNKQPHLEKALEEQSKKQHQLFIESTKSRIDNALATLTSKIGKIDQHYSLDATIKARALLLKLQAAKIKYYEALRKSTPGIDVANAGKEFRRACEKAITEAKSELEKDLDWGPYLQNLLKALVNAVTRSSFFTLKKSVSNENIEQAEQTLVLTEFTP